MTKHSHMHSHITDRRQQTPPPHTSKARARRVAGSALASRGMWMLMPVLVLILL